MKVFFVGVLSVTLLGCACPTAPQAMLETCTSKPCFYRTAASPPIELKPTPFKPNSTTTKVKPKTATKTAKKSSASAEAAKPNSPRTSNDSHKGKIASANSNDTQFFCAASAVRGERKDDCRNECECRGKIGVRPLKPPILFWKKQRPRSQEKWGTRHRSNSRT